MTLNSDTAQIGATAFISYATILSLVFVCRAQFRVAQR